MDLLQVSTQDALPQIRVVATPAGRKSAKPLQLDLTPEKKEILKKVRQSMIGEDITFLTPFGLKKVVYADFTASGRLSTFVESFMQSNVYPLYANTHSNSSWGPIQTAIYREEARALIKKSIGANQQDALIFCGSGSTCAINKLVMMMKVATTTFTIQDQELPSMIVLLSKFQHHSNILPWRETEGALVEFIQISKTGGFDYAMLQSKLKNYAQQYPGVQVIGSFSAGSNLTGQYVDVDRIAYLCHLHRALVFFDYACVAPYVDINLNGQTKLGFSRAWLKDDQEQLFSRLCYKDGIFVSTHKFVGGPGASGLLVMKARLIEEHKVPILPGGGSVLYVNQKEHIYIKNVQEREQAGTPNILGDIKAGLAFKLKHTIGVDTINTIDKRILEIVKERAKSMKNVIFHGNLNLPRVPIFVFNVKAFGKYLHYNFVCNLLNDLFGIFTRGGCSCAGPYGHELLKVDINQSHSIRDLILSGNEIFKMGFSRINFSYLWEESTINYLLDALQFISEHGWMFLPKYIPHQKTGQWTHLDGAKSYSQRESIHSLNILQETKSKKPLQNFDLKTVTESLTGVLKSLRLDYQQNGYQLTQEQFISFPEGSEGQQWFLTPQQARNQLINQGLSHIDCSINESLENQMISRSQRAISTSPKHMTATMSKDRIQKSYFARPVSPLHRTGSTEESTFEAASTKKIPQQNSNKVVGSKKFSSDSIVSQFKPRAKMNKRTSNMSMEFERETMRELHHSASQHKEFKLPSIGKTKVEKSARVQHHRSDRSIKNSLIFGSMTGSSKANLKKKISQFPYASMSRADSGAIKVSPQLGEHSRKTSNTSMLKKM